MQKRKVTNQLARQLGGSRLHCRWEFMKTLQKFNKFMIIIQEDLKKLYISDLGFQNHLVKIRDALAIFFQPERKLKT